MTVAALTVSCVIPVRDGERYLAESIESALSQSRPPLEVIVVDDGSTDGTAEIVRSFGDRVVPARQEPTGAPAARNRGLSLARGDLVAFLDADDLWVAENLARRAARFEERPDLDVSIALAVNFRSPDLGPAPEAAPLLGTPFPSHACCGIVARRGLFARIGPFDERAVFGENNEWIERARAGGAAIETLAEVLVRRRIHGRNMTRRRENEAATRSELLDRVKAMLDRKRRGAP